MTPTTPFPPLSATRRGAALGLLALGGLLPLLAPPSTPARACLHPPRDARVSLGESGQEALILYENGVEDLVLRVALRSDRPLSELAWVVPVPTVPEEYGLARRGLFRALARWVRLRWTPDPRLRVRSTSRGRKGGALRLLPPVRVGPYRVQPIQGRGPEAVEALSRWMAEHGFAAIPDESTRYYQERNWTFLAIRVQPPEGADLPSKSSLPPLRIRFRTPRIVYPLKFSSHMGQMAVRLYVLTPKPLSPSDLLGARRRGFHVWSARHGYLRASGPRHRLSYGVPAVLHARIRGPRKANRMPPRLAELVRNRWEERSCGTARKLWLTVLFAPHLNAPSRRGVLYHVTDWPEDLAIPAPPEGSRVQMDEAQWRERFLPVTEIESCWRGATGSPRGRRTSEIVDSWAD